MELGQRIRNLRSRKEMSQEELADKLYVSRQTISNWENDKSYPDIHSLLALSDLFDVSLDIMIKGDIEIMKEKISEKDIRKFKRDSNILTVLLILCMISAIPLDKFLGIPGLAVWGVIVAVTFYFSFRVEKVKKEQDIHTFKEIVAFCNGEKLDEISKAKEEGKRSYQKILFNLLLAAIGFIVGITISWLVY